MRSQSYQFLSIGIIVLVLITLLIIGYWVRASRELLVSVQNGEKTTVHDVVVYVADDEYPLGSLAPGEIRLTHIAPKHDSHLEIQFTDESGNQRRINAGGYVTPGIHGKIMLRIDAESVIWLENETTVSY